MTGKIFDKIRGAVSKVPVREMTSGAERAIKEQITSTKEDLEPISDENWYKRSAEACEGVRDALLREETGFSNKLVKGVSGKLGFAGTGAGIFSVASLLGTAGTGTAIGSLSGAAFTNAALAWVGGSVIAGTAIIGAASIAGGIGTILGVGWLKRKYVSGETREKSELELQEQRVLDVCLSLAIAFREQEKAGRLLDPMTASAVYGDALKPLCEELMECNYRANSWPVLAKRNLKIATAKLHRATGYIYRWSKDHPNVSTGIVSVVVLQLLADGIPSFSENEQFVLEALRRSNNELTNATDEELAAYIQSMEPVQLSGLTNNIKGIYHELLFQHEENSDGDQYIIEIFDATNHAGSDVRIINTVTDEVKEVQLKATKYVSYVREHNEKYENIEVFATEEVARTSGDLTSTGFSNSELNEDVGNVFEGLDDFDSPSALMSMSTAAMITLARNSRVLLRGGGIPQAEKEKMVKDGAISAGVAGFVHLIL
ncbi:MAG: hypothetical protein ACRBBV_13115 [Paracoccaceae bacterium]